ncbi:MAG: DUF4093 domain-containing protein [Oscillospiraceae bacterium]|nr:DUF4093 domain-containing protein [Oscillospiraceae bacterium]
MIHIKQAIVVEGKYDKVKLSSILDAVILVTNGFQIYKNSEQLDLIRYYARTTGVILLTDADRAGFQIRNYLKGAIQDGEVYHVYTPDIYGKEHRKEKPSAEGKLGVEGIRKDLLLAAFEKAGVLTEEKTPKSPEEQITVYDLYEAGLSGSADSSERRRALQKKLSLPARMSTASLLEVLNTMYTKKTFLEMMTEE